LLAGFRALPTNWYRTVFCTDLFTEVEIVPGTGNAWKLSYKISGLREYKINKPLIITTVLGAFVLFFIAVILTKIFSITESITTIFFVVALFIITFLSYTMMFAISWNFYLLCWLTGFAYRVSLKSTAFVWLPLIYLVNLAIESKEGTVERVTELRESALWRLVVFLSWGALILFAVRYIMLPTVVSRILEAQGTPKVLAAYLTASTWHIAAAVNAILALVGYYFFIDPAPRRLKNKTWGIEFVFRGLKWFRLTRGIISVYTIAAGIVITLAHIPDLSLAELDWALFPKLPEWLLMQ